MMGSILELKQQPYPDNLFSYRISLERGIPMSLNELLTTARTLCRADRIRLVQYLVADLAREEGITSLEEGAAYSIPTPLNAFQAAATMLEALGKQTEET